MYNPVIEFIIGCLYFGTAIIGFSIVGTAIFEGHEAVYRDIAAAKTAVADWIDAPPSCSYRAEPQGDGTYKLYRC